jgi:hypothetical protein
MNIERLVQLHPQVPSLLLSAALTALSVSAAAAETVDGGAAVARAGQTAEAAPIVSLTHGARGAPAKAIGASAFGTATFALSGDVNDDNQLGGGFRVWGSPIDRLTLIGEALRRDNGEMAPALTLQVRFWENESFALGALGRLKSEGFAEIEGEVELGLLGSYDSSGSHVEVNVVAGRGFEEEETDGELNLRAGRDIGQMLRVGVDSRVRYRLAGDAVLAGGRKWDAFAGPELTLSFDHLYGALLTGPSTVGVLDGVGWESMLTVGGTL